MTQYFPGIYHIMSDPSISALLLDAKREYMLRLLEICIGPVATTIHAMFQRAIQQESNGLYAFQQALRTVPAWNQHVVLEKSNEITSKFPYVDDLIAACIVTQVKIMSSIRLSSDKPNIRLNLPATTDFVHQLYIQTAKRVYEDPFVMTSETTPVLALEGIVNEALERTVRKMIPFQDVLQAYLQSGGETSKAAEAIATATSSESSDDFKPEKPRPPAPSYSESSSEEEEELIQVPIPQNIVQPPPAPQATEAAAPAAPAPPPPAPQPAEASAPPPTAPAPAAAPPPQPAAPQLFASGPQQLRQGF
jgi:hypothetical protein